MNILSDIFQNIKDPNAIKILLQFSCDDYYSLVLLQQGMLKYLFPLMTSDFAIKSKILIIIGNIASGTIESIEILIHSEIFSCVIDCITDTNILFREEASFTLQMLSAFANEDQLAFICNDYNLNQIHQAMTQEGKKIVHNYLVFISNVLEKNIPLSLKFDFEQFYYDKNLNISNTAENILKLN